MSYKTSYEAKKTKKLFNPKKKFLSKINYHPAPQKLAEATEAMVKSAFEFQERNGTDKHSHRNLIT